MSDKLVNVKLDGVITPLSIFEFISVIFSFSTDLG